METTLGKAKPGFYKFLRKAPDEPGGRSHGPAVLVTGKLGYQGGYKTPQIRFIRLDDWSDFQVYDESATIKIETVSNKIGFDTIFSR